MEVLYHGIKTRYAYDFPLCFPHELIMSLRNIYIKLLKFCVTRFTISSDLLQIVPTSLISRVHVTGVPPGWQQACSSFMKQQQCHNLSTDVLHARCEHISLTNCVYLKWGMQKWIFLLYPTVTRRHKSHNTRNVLRRQCWDTNRNIKRLVYCRYRK